MNHQIITLLYNFKKAIKKINAYWHVNGRTELLSTEIKRFEKEILNPLDELWEKETLEDRREFIKII